MESSFDGRYTNANEGKLQFRLKQDTVSCYKIMYDRCMETGTPIWSISDEECRERGFPVGQ
jgi:hypothetical protein